MLRSAAKFLHTAKLDFASVHMKGGRAGVDFEAEAAGAASGLRCGRGGGRVKVRSRWRVVWRRLGGMAWPVHR